MKKIVIYEGCIVKGVKTMDKYYRCEVRMDDKEQTIIPTLNFCSIPKIGEHLTFRVGDNFYNFLVSKIFHNAFNEWEISHEVIVYVKFVEWNFFRISLPLVSIDNFSSVKISVVFL